MSADDIAALNGIILATFTTLLFLGVLRTTVRLVEYRHAKKRVPVILWRDLVFHGGLSIPFLLIFMARAFAWNVIGQLWWIVITATPALIAAATYTLFEFFVIDHQRFMDDGAHAHARKDD